jgi:hypothetical protein
VNLGCGGWDWPNARIRAENTGRESEIKRVQQFTAKDSKLKFGQPPAASRAHSEVVLLCFQRRILYKPVVT